MAKSISVVVSGNAAPLRKALGEAGDSIGSFGGSVKKYALPAAAALGAVAFAGFDAAKAAMEDEAAAAELARQLKKTTGATDDQIASTEKWISKLVMATGQSDEKLRPALASLVRGTEDITKAQGLMALAQDISIGKNKDLGSVADALSAAYDGNMKKLQALDPEIKTMVKNHASLDEIMKHLGDTFGGATATYAESLAGRMARLKETAAEIYEQIGYALLPIMEKFAGFLADTVIPYAQKLADAFSKDGISGAIKTAAGDFDNFIASAEGWNAVIINLTGTVLLLGAAFKTFSFLTGISAAITAIQTSMVALSATVPALLGASIGAILAVAALAAVAVYTLVDALRDPSFRQSFGEVIINSLKGVANAFILTYKIIRAGINSLVDVVNTVNPFGNLAKLPDVKFQDFTFTPQMSSSPAPTGRAGSQGVTAFAQGGIVTSPRLGLVGEAGPEAIIPLSKLGAMGNTYSITVQAGVGDPREIGRQVVDAIKQFERTAGPVFQAA